MTSRFEPSYFSPLLAIFGHQKLRIGLKVEERRGRGEDDFDSAVRS